MLSFTVTPRIEKQLKQLHGLLVEAYKDLDEVGEEEKAYLNKCALISNVGATTRIENAVLTDVEIEWVDSVLTKDGRTTAFEKKKEFIIDKLSKERQRSVEEVAGSRSVLKTIYLQAKEFRPLREADIRALHQELLQFYPSAAHYAGGYKTSANRVVSRNAKTGAERTVLEPAEPGVMTNMAMRELLDWYNESIVNYPWHVLVAVEFVFRFLAIHPFQDGNGRMGRALFLLALLQSGDNYLESVIPLIAIDRKIEQNTARYYTVLHQCSDGRYRADPKKYRYDSLVLFTLNILESALADIVVYREKFKNLKQLPESAIKVLECFKSNPEKPLKVADIEASIKLPRRTIQFALHTLTNQAFLQKLGKAAGTRYQLVF